MSKPIINLPDEHRGDPMLKDLKPGDVFMYHENLYMKVPKAMCYDTRCDHCVLSLERGVFSRSINDYDTVIPVKVTMNVEYE